MSHEDRREERQEKNHEREVIRLLTDISLSNNFIARAIIEETRILTEVTRILKEIHAELNPKNNVTRFTIQQTT